MGFQVYEKGSAPVASTPSVTIQKKGLISINRAAFELAGRPEGVELLWDPDEKLIALRPAFLDNPNAYPVRSQNKEAERGPWLIAGTLFTQYIKLDTSEAFRWVPTLRDDLLVIDVGKPGQRAVSNRQRAAERQVVTAEEAVTT